MTWDHQVAALSEAGYGSLAPNSLGFGRSDMPTDVQEYRSKRLADHLVELLDYNGLQTVVGVSHDWGSSVMSRVAFYHQDRLEKLIWIATGYQALGFLDIDAANARGLEELGYTPFGYFYFLDRFDAGKVLREDLTSVWHIAHPENHTVWLTELVGLGALRTWLTEDNTMKEAPFMDQEHKEDWFEWMSRPNATEASTNVYRSQLRGVNHEDQTGITNHDQMLHVPNLFIGARDDVITIPEWQIEATEPYAAAGFEATIIPGGHSLPMERPDEVSQLLIDFGSR